MPLDTLHLVNLRSDGRSPLTHRPITAHLPPPSDLGSNPPPSHPSSKPPISAAIDSSLQITGESYYSSGVTSVHAQVFGPYATNKVPVGHSKPPLTITISAPTHQSTTQTVTLCSFSPFQPMDLNLSNNPVTARLTGYLQSVLSVFESAIIQDPFEAGQTALHLHCTVTAADGSLLPAIINGLSLALITAGVNLLDIPTAVCVAGMSVNAPVIGTANRRMEGGRHKVGGNKVLGGEVRYVADPSGSEEASVTMAGVVTLCFLLHRDSLVLAQSDTVDLAGYLEMVTSAKEVARGVRESLEGYVRDYLEVGFRARLGEGEVEDDEGFVVLN